MKIEGGFVVDAPIDRVWLAIRDPAVVAPCIPGCQAVEPLSANVYRAGVRVVFGPIATTFNVTVEITAEEPPHRLACVTRGEEGGKASSLTAHSELILSVLAPDRTQIQYSSDVSVFGRLGRYGLGMMKKKAEAIGTEFAVTFAQRLAALRSAEAAS